MDETLEREVTKFAREIDKLRVNRQGGRSRPHKFIMLLTVAHLFEQKYLTDNRIYFDDVLKQEFAKVFDQCASKKDACLPSQPFFHLRSADFWEHRIIAGKETSYSYLTTSGGGEKRIREHIEYAYLSDYAYNALSNPEARAQIIYVLAEKLRENHGKG